MEFKSDIQIAQESVMTNISELAAQVGIDEQYLELYGKYKAKIDYRLLKDKADTPDGKLVLVTAISPTPAGEGQDHDNRRSCGCPAQNGQKCICCFERTILRAGIRYQGRRGRRRLRAGSSDGGHQSALHQGDCTRRHCQ